MRVVKRSVSKINGLKDFFVKELDGEYNNFEIINSFKNDNSVTIACDLQDDYLCIVVDIFNKKTGINLGARLYEIPLFDKNNEKVKITFPYEQIGLSIIECLEAYDVKFEQLGNGVISDWLMSNDETIMTKLWFSNDYKYVSISRKILKEPTEETISKEDLLDKLGL